MKKRRIISLLAAALMVFSITACADTNASQPEEIKPKESKSDESKPEESKPEAASQADTEAGGTVKIMSAVTGGKDEEEMELFAEALSEATGLIVEIEKPASEYDTVLMQKLSGGEAYDLIYVSASQYSNLVDQGALMDITERVNGSEILTGNVDPAEWKDITIDGKIYAGFNK